MDATPGAMPGKVWAHLETIREPTPGVTEIRKDAAGNHYEFQGSHKAIDDTGIPVHHVIVKPVEAPGTQTNWGNVNDLEGPLPLTTSELQAKHQDWLDKLGKSLPDFTPGSDQGLPDFTEADYNALQEKLKNQDLESFKEHIALAAQGAGCDR